MAKRAKKRCVTFRYDGEGHKLKKARKVCFRVGKKGTRGKANAYARCVGREMKRAHVKGKSPRTVRGAFKKAAGKCS